MIRKTVLIAVLATLSGCSFFSKPDLEIEATFSDQIEDGSKVVHIATIFGDQRIDFGSQRITAWSLSTVEEQGDSLSILLWTPGQKFFDTSKVVILVHGYQALLLSMYPLALEITRLGYPVVMLSHRGYNRNEHLQPTLGLAEADDVGKVISAYAEFMNVKSVKVAAFGSSLGGAIILNAGFDDERFVAIACEGLWFDTQLAVSKMLANEDLVLYQQLREHYKMRYRNMEPPEILRKIKHKPLYLLWGENDKLVSADDKQRLLHIAQENNSSVKSRIIKQGSHSLRYGFPLSPDEAIKLNRNIAEFLISNF